MGVLPREFRQHFRHAIETNRLPGRCGPQDVQHGAVYPGQQSAPVIMIGGTILVDDPGGRGEERQGLGDAAGPMHQQAGIQVQCSFD